MYHAATIISDLFVLEELYKDINCWRAEQRKIKQEEEIISRPEKKPKEGYSQ